MSHIGVAVLAGVAKVPVPRIADVAFAGLDRGPTGHIVTDYLRQVPHPGSQSLTQSGRRVSKRPDPSAEPRQPSRHARSGQGLEADQGRRPTWSEWTTSIGLGLVETRAEAMGVTGVTDRLAGAYNTHCS